MAEWRPVKVRTRPWADIERFYGEIWEPWPPLVAIKQLCQHIAKSTYGNLIFGATSMHTLLVGQHDTLEWSCNMLRVEAAIAQRVTFSFHEKEFVAPVVFTCAPEAAVETFERFIHRAKWVSETSS